MVGYSELLGVDADRRQHWQRMSDLMAPLPLTTDPISGKTVLGSQDGMPPAAFPQPASPGNARYPIVFFMGIHPGEIITRSSDPDLLTAARDTVAIVNSINQWSPTNGLCMAWPPEARVTADAAATLRNFLRGLNRTLQANLWPNIQSGCNMEQAGATAAVNDLLMASHEGFIRLFPAGWEEGQAASFATLRAEGAFLVSAATSGGSDVRNVTLRSLAGQRARIRNPFVLPRNSSVCVSEALTGVSIPVADEGGDIAGFNTKSNVDYVILQCQHEHEHEHEHEGP
jgi:hypothetical protein